MLGTNRTVGGPPLRPSPIAAEMDWSRVYEDGGEEEAEFTVESINDNFASRTAATIRGISAYNPTVMYFFCVNYILGVGCLGLPYSFLQSGMIQGTLLVILLSFVSYVTCLYVAEASYRGMQFKIDKSTSNPFKSPKLGRRGSIGPDNSGDETNDIVVSAMRHGMRSIASFTNLSSQSSKKNLLETSTIEKISTSSTNINPPIAPTAYSSLALDQLKAKYKYERGWVESPSKKAASSSSAKLQVNSKDVKSSSEPKKSSVAPIFRECEVIELVDEFLGPSAKTIYQINLMLLTYVGLIAYAQVFSQGLISQILEPSNVFGDYANKEHLRGALSVSLFAAIVIPLSLLNISEQIYAQITMALLRFVSLAALLLGTLAAIAIDDKDSAIHWDASTTQNSSNNNSDTNFTLPYFKLSGFGIMFTTAIFSQLFQHSVPGLIAPLQTAEKKAVPRIFAAALVTTGLVYISTGICCVYFFGHRTKESINLNFVDFFWGYDSTNDYWVAAVSDVVSKTIVLFPVLDTLSVFPLIAITLGNNLHTASFKFINNNILKRVYTESKLASKQATSRLNIMWRVVACFPPILISSYISSFSFIIQLAGCAGIIVALITPALLQRAINKSLEEVTRSSLLASPYTHPFSRERHVNTVLYIGFTGLAICIYQML